jgi:protein TonB
MSALARAALAVAMVLATAFAVAAQDPVHVGGDMPPPQRIKHVDPVYPAEAIRARVEGVVVIDATVDPAGRVSRAEVKRSIPMLDQAAVDAVRQWEYTPTLVNGVAVPVLITVSVGFSLQDAGVAPPSAAPAPPPAIRLTSQTTQSGRTTIVWEVSAETGRQLPHWDPAQAPAPFSANDIEADAVAWLKRRTPDVQRFDLQAIVLSRVRRSAAIDFWFYQLDFFGYGNTRMADPLFKVVVLPDRSIVEPHDLASPASPAGQPFAPGPGVTYPRLVNRVDAQYTDEARRRKIAGTVLLDCVVNPDGMVGDVRIARSLDAQYGLDEEAVKAVKQYRFTPGTKDGQAVPVRVTIEVSFFLK